MGCASSKEPLGQEDLEYMLEKTNYDEHTIQGSFICNVKRIYSELIQLVIRALVYQSEFSLVRMDYVTQKYIKNLDISCQYFSQSIFYRLQKILHDIFKTIARETKVTYSSLTIAFSITVDSGNSKLGFVTNFVY